MSLGWESKNFSKVEMKVFISVLRLRILYIKKSSDSPLVTLRVNKFEFRLNSGVVQSV